MTRGTGGRQRVSRSVLRWCESASHLGWFAKTLINLFKAYLIMKISEKAFFIMKGVRGCFVLSIVCCGGVNMHILAQKTVKF